MPKIQDLLETTEEFARNMRKISLKASRFAPPGSRNRKFFRKRAKEWKTLERRG